MQTYLSVMLLIPDIMMRSRSTTEEMGISTKQINFLKNFVIQLVKWWKGAKNWWFS